MEHLEPTVDGGDWDGLTERQQEFYRLCVESLLAEPVLVRIAAS